MKRSPIQRRLMILAVGLCACATTPVVSTRLADGIQLQQYKTYTLETGPVQDVQGQVHPGDQTEIGRYLEKCVRAELEQRGLKPMDLGADISFHYAAAREEKQWTEQKWPYDERWPYQEGAVDIVASDPAGHTVWLAHLQAVIDPHDKNHSQLKKAIAKAFEKYPRLTHS